MAHRGKYYPVAFRRDFNFNCDIRSTTALADSYEITLHSGVTPPYGVEGFLFFLSTLPMPDERTLAWGCTDVEVDDELWSIRLRVEFSALPEAWLTATWFLFRSGFLCSSWRGVPRSRENPLDAGNLITQQVLFTDFSTFPSGADFNHSRTVAHGYTP